MPLHHKLRLHISWLFRVCFILSCLGEEYYSVMVHHIYLFAASCVRDSGETLEKPLHMSSPLGTRVRVDQICRGCGLEISEILLKVDLRVMDMSEFEVILGMDWLTAHRVVIDCDRKRVTAYTHDGTCIMFQGVKHDALPRPCTTQVAWAVDGLADKPYPKGRGETGHRSTSGSLQVRGCFSGQTTGITFVEGCRLCHRVTPWYVGRGQSPSLRSVVSWD